MANEANVQASLTIRVGNLDYQSRPQGFTADVSTAKGPSPGALVIPTGGKVIDFSSLTTPGLCRIANLDSTNYVEYGTYDPDNDLFFPLGEILAGESYVIRLSRNLNEEYVGTGTGTTGPNNNFFFKANTADCVVLVEAFEK